MSTGSGGKQPQDLSFQDVSSSNPGKISNVSLDNDPLGAKNANASANVIKTSKNLQNMTAKEKQIMAEKMSPQEKQQMVDQVKASGKNPEKECVIF